MDTVFKGLDWGEYLRSRHCVRDIPASERDFFDSHKRFDPRRVEQNLVALRAIDETINPGVDACGRQQLQDALFVACRDDHAGFG